MKTAVFGGSFDPVHEGHMALGRYVIGNTAYERILFIPAARPPHKTISGDAADSERLEMLTLSTQDEAWAEVWDGEMRRSGPSYTIDTIHQLHKEKILDGRPGLVIGDDLVDGFAGWHRVEELVAEVDIILAHRNGTSPSTGGDETGFPYPCLRLDNPRWPQSSTEVRRAIAAGGALEGVVPAAAADYIRRKRLYGYPG